ncbi:hypothetical protein AUP68_13393 [Ilyonectria robusta]
MPSGPENGEESRGTRPSRSGLLAIVLGPAKRTGTRGRDLGLAGPSPQDDDLQIGGRFLRAERRTRSPVKPPGREVWT